MRAGLWLSRLSGANPHSQYNYSSPNDVARPQCLRPVRFRDRLGSTGPSFKNGPLVHASMPLVLSVENDRGEL